jgi:hypothetical protein
LRAKLVEAESKTAVSRAALAEEIRGLAADREALERTKAAARAQDEEHARILAEGARVREEGAKARAERERAEKDLAEKRALLEQVQMNKLAKQLLDGAVTPTADNVGADIYAVAGTDAQLAALILLIESVKLGNAAAQQILSDNFDGVDINDLYIPGDDVMNDAEKTAQVVALIDAFVRQHQPAAAGAGAAPAHYGTAATEAAAGRHMIVRTCLIGNIVQPNIDDLVRSEKAKSYSKSGQQNPTATIAHGNTNVDKQQVSDFSYSNLIKTLNDTIWHYVSSSIQALWSLCEQSKLFVLCKHLHISFIAI